MSLAPCHWKESQNLRKIRLERFFRPVFRSYKPTADELEEGVLPEGRTSEVTDHVAEELSKETEGVVVNELDFMNLAPRYIYIFFVIALCV